MSAWLFAAVENGAEVRDDCSRRLPGERGLSGNHCPRGSRRPGGQACSPRNFFANFLYSHASDNKLWEINNCISGGHERGHLLVWGVFSLQTVLNLSRGRQMAGLLFSLRNRQAEWKQLRRAPLGAKVNLSNASRLRTDFSMCESCVAFTGVFCLHSWAC